MGLDPESARWDGDEDMVEKPAALVQDGLSSKCLEHQVPVDQVLAAVLRAELALAVGAIHLGEWKDLGSCCQSAVMDLDPESARLDGDEDMVGKLAALVLMAAGLDLQKVAGPKEA